MNDAASTKVVTVKLTAPQALGLRASALPLGARYAFVGARIVDHLAGLGLVVHDGRSVAITPAGRVALAAHEGSAA